MKWSDLFYYDESSPSCLRWLEDKMCGKHYKMFARRKGAIAGTCKTYTGRWQLRIDNKAYLAHRVIYEMHYGSIEDGRVIDHIDGNPLNNKIDNLRLLVPEENARNCKKRLDNMSGVVGVSRQDKCDLRYTNIPTPYYVSQWSGSDGLRKSKSFNIDVLGEAEAFNQACNHRAAMITKLNEQGAGYTGRHGT